MLSGMLTDGHEGDDDDDGDSLLMLRGVVADVAQLLLPVAVSQGDVVIPIWAVSSNTPLCLGTGQEGGKRQVVPAACLDELLHWNVLTHLLWHSQPASCMHRYVQMYITDVVPSHSRPIRCNGGGEVVVVELTNAVQLGVVTELY